MAPQLEHAFKIVRANPTLYKTDKGKGSSSQKLSGKPGTENAFSEQHWGSMTASFSKSVVKCDDLILLRPVLLAGRDGEQRGFRG